MTNACVCPADDEVEREIPPDGGPRTSDFDIVIVWVWLWSDEDVNVFSSPGLLGDEGPLPQRDVIAWRAAKPMPRRPPLRNSFLFIFSPGTDPGKIPGGGRPPPGREYALRAGS